MQTHKKGACEDVGQKHKRCQDTEHHGTSDGYEMERSRNEDKAEGRRVMKESRERCKR